MNEFTIMMIDDDEVDRYLLKRALKSAGYVSYIFEAENGQAAIDFLSNYEDNAKQYPERFPPIIIFLDINMPLMDGFEFLEAFVKLRACTHVFNKSMLALYTSSKCDEDKHKAQGYDFVKGYLVKESLSVHSLKKTIESCTA
ncbi:response regulator [Pseudoalteromonas sp. SMS1]|uniref:response regulator n=1 Tax=Pseudoalteromonas sp. SMS1 TaxID=2908894 RepID=UPI001F1A514C|nr:response regulator [Pseudoalteromonas sp. SMS1]MCF2860124.1 response regulator [Pseudoalteromonas sp. SMS1]